jgi:hypothetical protein
VVGFTTGSRGNVPGKTCEKRRNNNNNNLNRSGIAIDDGRQFRPVIPSQRAVAAVMTNFAIHTC